MRHGRENPANMRVAEDSPATRNGLAACGRRRSANRDRRHGRAGSALECNKAMRGVMQRGDDDGQPLRPVTIGVRAAWIAGNNPPAMPTRSARTVP